MNRRQLLTGLVTTAALAAAGPAFALSYAEDVVKQLTKLGFLEIHVETTLLGRVRIVAERSDGMREIVLNPRTGEILRDVWTPSAGGAVRNVLADVEDDGDADADDDSSGSGSGGGDDNSGSGGGSDDGGRDDREDREDRGDDNKKD